MVTFVKVPMTVPRESGDKPDCIYSVGEKLASLLCDLNRSEIGP